LNERPASNFAAKLIVLKRVAKVFGRPQRIVDAGGEYMRALIGISPSFRALAEIGYAQTTVTTEDRAALA
jgi:hypothetical protein